MTSDVTIVWHCMHKIMDLATSPTYEAKYVQQEFSPQQVEVNMVGGTAAWCLKTLVRQDDLMTARERIKADRGQGTTYEEELRAMKRITGGKLFKVGQVRIGKTIFQIHKDNDQEKKCIAQVKSAKENMDYAACVAAATDLIASGVNPDNPRTIKQLKILIAPYKRKEDSALPIHKSQLLEYYHTICLRPSKDVLLPHAHTNDDPNDDPNDDIELTGDEEVEAFEGYDSNTEANDLATAMLSLAEYSTENIEAVST